MKCRCQNTDETIHEKEEEVQQKNIYRVQNQNGKKKQKKKLVWSSRVLVVWRVAGQMAVMMEDLTGTRALDQIEGATLAQAVTVMRDMGRTHVRRKGRGLGMGGGKGGWGWGWVCVRFTLLGFVFGWM